MSRRYPRAKWVLPNVIDPPDRVCFQIEVPRDRLHIAAFRGALLNLASAINWQDDPSHKARNVAAVWQDVYDKVRTCAAVDGGAGIYLEDLMSQQIRINPDDQCIIQMWCIDHWEDWFNARTCAAGGIQQPTNGTPLGDGECREWVVALPGNQQWLLPLSVSEGDTIQISGAAGAWNDGTAFWFCPNGKAYVFGGCGGDTAAGISDPLQTVNHMSLIMNVDASWYDAYNTIFAVPTGVTDSQVVFQANDSTLNDNSGTLSFHVKVCRQASAPVAVNITYGYGSGPSSVLPGQYITMSSSCCGGGGGADWGIGMTFDRAVKITVVSQTGFVLNCTGAGDCLWNNIENPVGTIVAVQYLHDGSDPLALPPTVGVVYQIDSVAASAAFTVTLLIENP